MAFYGCEFSFDGVPCSEFGLMVYNFESKEQDSVSFGNGDIIEDRLQTRYDSLMYGFDQNKALEYTLVFGANFESIDVGQSIDRFDIEAISSWLTGHNTWKWLTITQDDMETFRYKCVITDLEPVIEGMMPWGFTCKVTCDSQFAYTLPEKFNLDVSSTMKYSLFNRSSYNGYYYPSINIMMRSGNSFSIINHSDNDRLFEFKELPTSESLVIDIDNKNQVITNNLNMNLYPYFNKKFMRFVRGNNHLTISGDAFVKIVCEFPVNIGG